MSLLNEFQLINIDSDNFADVIVKVNNNFKKLSLYYFDGVVGEKGLSGLPGSMGLPGSPGKQGQKGDAGENGSMWHIIENDPNQDLGVNNDFALNRKTREIWERDAGAWINRGLLEIDLSQYDIVNYFDSENLNNEINSLFSKNTNDTLLLSNLYYEDNLFSFSNIKKLTYDWLLSNSILSDKKLKIYNSDSSGYGNHIHLANSKLLTLNGLSEFREKSGFTIDNDYQEESSKHIEFLKIVGQKSTNSDHIHKIFFKSNQIQFQNDTVNEISSPYFIFGDYVPYVGGNSSTVDAKTYFSGAIRMAEITSTSIFPPGTFYYKGNKYYGVIDNQTPKEFMFADDSISGDFFDIASYVNSSNALVDFDVTSTGKLIFNKGNAIQYVISTTTDGVLVTIDEDVLSAYVQDMIDAAMGGGGGGGLTTAFTKVKLYSDGTAVASSEINSNDADVNNIFNIDYNPKSGLKIEKGLADTNKPSMYFNYTKPYLGAKIILPSRNIALAESKNQFISLDLNTNAEQILYHEGYVKEGSTAQYTSKLLNDGWSANAKYYYAPLYGYEQYGENEPRYADIVDFPYTDDMSIYGGGDVMFLSYFDPTSASKKIGFINKLVGKHAYTVNATIWGMPIVSLNSGAVDINGRMDVRNIFGYSRPISTVLTKVDFAGEIIKYYVDEFLQTHNSETIYPNFSRDVNTSYSPYDSAKDTNKTDTNFYFNIKTENSATIFLEENQGCEIGFLIQQAKDLVSENVITNFGAHLNPKIIKLIIQYVQLDIRYEGKLIEG